MPLFAGAPTSTSTLYVLLVCYISTIRRLVIDFGCVPLYTYIVVTDIACVHKSRYNIITGSRKFPSFARENCYTPMFGITYFNPNNVCNLEKFEKLKISTLTLDNAMEMLFDFKLVILKIRY